MSTQLLVPLDGSTPSWKAMDHALEQSDTERVVGLHVVDLSAIIYGGPEGDLFDRAVHHGRTICERARARFADHDSEPETKFETTIETGQPAREIIQYADEHDVDRIVLGSHGRSGVSRILLGSVAETVVRRAPVPVTIVR